MSSITLWTVYDHPRDYPNNFVARRFEGAVRPMSFTHCGQCLSTLAEQARAFTARQTRPKAE